MGFSMGHITWIHMLGPTWGTIQFSGGSYLESTGIMKVEVLFMSRLIIVWREPDWKIFDDWEWRRMMDKVCWYYIGAIYEYLYLHMQIDIHEHPQMPQLGRESPVDMRGFQGTWCFQGWTVATYLVVERQLSIAPYLSIIAANVAQQDSPGRGHHWVIHFHREWMGV
jgi:hypothetical protein